MPPAWTAFMNAHYGAESGGYFLVADDTSDLIMRPLSASDDATPSPNATMLQNLADLYAITGDTAYLTRADALLGAFQGAAQTMAIAYTGLLSGALTLISPQHIVIAGDKASADAAPWRKAFPRSPFPTPLCNGWTAARRFRRLRPPPERPGDGKITAYVCIGQRCSMPLTEPSF